MTARVEPAAAHAHTTLAAGAAPQRESFANLFDRAVALADATGAAPATLGDAADARSALELQLVVYRRAERLELASKVLDSGVSAIKTILQTRV